jgi:hypothetical protein
VLDYAKMTSVIIRMIWFRNWTETITTDLITHHVSARNIIPKMIQYDTI